MSRVLFDKNVPYRMRRYLSHHNVLTAAEQGWDRLVNGELLTAAEADGFGMAVAAASEGSYEFVRYELPPKPGNIQKKP